MGPEVIQSLFGQAAAAVHKNYRRLKFGGVDAAGQSVREIIAGSDTDSLAACTGIEISGVPPKSTSVAPVKLPPVIVTVVPPVNGPLAGLTAVTTGVETMVPL